MKYLTVILTIVFVTYGQIAIKYGVNKLGPLPSHSFKSIIAYLFSALFSVWIVTGLVAAGFAALSWIAAMSKFELSSVYPLLSINFILVPLLSILIFNEAFNLYKLFGAIIIVLGIVIFTRGLN
jgi:uncharacterized membrane protein